MWKNTYHEWLRHEGLEADLLEDLKNKSEAELEDMFYTSLVFGTGGMRGLLGSGTNRLNIYTIRKANVGLAKYLLDTYSANELHRGVVIAHDNRKYSRVFAFESAKVLGAYGIKSFIFDSLRPTPELSFATRYLGAISGIVITASHNPPNYNGYKIYDEYGCQYTPQYAEKIIRGVEEVKDVFAIGTKTINELEAENLLEEIGPKIDEAYLDYLVKLQIHPEVDKSIKIVFTPLHGTSSMIAPKLLKKTGYDVAFVEEQMIPDPNFSTVSSPNPENPMAFQLAEALGKKIDADLLIATDPDADRLGVAVKMDYGYYYLSGNQTGAILINYILNEKKKLNALPAKGVVYNTIVTSDLGAKIARSFGLEVVSTLTGFKYIGEQARYLEGTDKTFVFGYEESFGYVIDDNVRDKDALQALLIVSEAASFYKETEGKTLYDKLQDIFLRYGYHSETLKNVELTGVEGKKRINRIMDYFVKNHLKTIAGRNVLWIEDYNQKLMFIGEEQKTLTLPRSDVIKYMLADDSWFVLRPSGTEPKLKIYVASSGKTAGEANGSIREVLDVLMKMIHTIS
ncbi:MAG: phospho-sugar mutase [Candidatus Izemoplasmatales bacterium]|nr:phospho-sugar mutase [Candidatus Izemoplasmatales bacterium]